MNGPERTCVGCRRVRPKPELTRIVRLEDGTVAIDRSGIAPGRGAYVCGLGCLDRARGRLGRALRVEASDHGKLAAELALVEGEEA